MPRDIVVFKGNRDGLCLTIDEETDLHAIQKKIRDKIASAQSFFQDVKKVQLQQTSLSLEDEITLINWLREEYAIEIDYISQEDASSPLEELDSDQPIGEGPTKYLYTTLRSGTSIKYNGSVIVVGDVNPGAEIIATGNIIVMGVLRGIAHAGVLGNDAAMVVAFSLEPTQLRISNIIARSPDHQEYKPTYPEKACINDQSIVILPYHKNV